jgi:RNA polymerase sigma-70 factor (ECF subfamily)
MADHVSDATLLERFVTRREEAAFAALVQRHGPRVLGACRRILRNEHDAEDAFQATFLLLARRAADIPWRESVGGWLCAVAHRLSLKARAGAARRCRHEMPVAALAAGGDGPGQGDYPLPEEYHPLADPLPEIARRELRRLLGDELDRLPEKYRAPMVLCYLEGMTSEEAARRLGWPAGSMSRRLGRARSLLRRRLAGRGLSLAILLLFAAVATLGIWRAVPRGRGPITVREAMSPFKRTEGGGQDLERALARISRVDQSLPERHEILRVARQSCLVAEQIEDHDPGEGRAEWRQFAGEMRRSALILAQATRENNRPAVIAAARRLDSSCVQCHVAFRR